MTDNRYDLVITGQLLPNVEKSAAIAQLAKLLKIEQAQAEKLLNGKAQRIKKAANEDLAKKFIKAFQQAGVELVAKQTTSQNQSAGQNYEDTAPSADPPKLSFTEQGDDLLQANEKRHFEYQDLAGEFELAEVGAEIELLAVQRTPLNPNIEHLAVADAGELIPNLEKPPAQVPPDLSHLSLESH